MSGAMSNGARMIEPNPSVTAEDMQALVTALSTLAAGKPLTAGALPGCVKLIHGGVGLEHEVHLDESAPFLLVHGGVANKITATADANIEGYVIVHGGSANDISVSPNVRVGTSNNMNFVSEMSSAPTKWVDSTVIEAGDLSGCRLLEREPAAGAPQPPANRDEIDARVAGLSPQERDLFSCLAAFAPAPAPFQMEDFAIIASGAVGSTEAEAAALGEKLVALGLLKRTGDLLEVDPAIRDYAETLCS